MKDVRRRGGGWEELNEVIMDRDAWKVNCKLAIGI